MKYFVYIKDLEDVFGVSLKKIKEFIKEGMNSENVSGTVYSTNGRVFVKILNNFIHRNDIIEKCADDLKSKTKWEDYFKSYEANFFINHKTSMKLLEEFNPEEKERVLKKMEDAYSKTRRSKRARRSKVFKVSDQLMRDLEKNQNNLKVQDKDKKTGFSYDSRLELPMCPVCHENGCMCSDPFI